MTPHLLHPSTIHGGTASYHGLLTRHLDENLFEALKSINFIIEGGSRDCADAIKLHWALNQKVYAFECNPTAANICRKNLALNSISTRQVELVERALHHKTDKQGIDFYCTIDTPQSPFGAGDINLIATEGKRANIGTSSIHPFNDRWKEIHRSSKITVPSTTLDNFIETIDQKTARYILCMDLQGGEFYALKGNSKYLQNCELIILEADNHQYTTPVECNPSSLKLFLENKGFIHANEGEKGDWLFIPLRGKSALFQFGHRRVNK